VSSTSITAVTPSGSGSVNVVVTNPDGQTGTLVNGFSYGATPVATSVTHTPANPTTTDNVTISATFTDDVGITKIELYLDGTTPAQLVHTCLFSPSQTPATCAKNVGTLSNASHTTTAIATDTDTTTGQGSETFGISGSTTAGTLNLSRLKAGTSNVDFSLVFTLSATESGTLTVTFPVGFTVTAAASGGSSSACLSSFGSTSSTLTATKTACSGTVTLAGAKLTLPSTPGVYTISWTNDSGSGQVVIVDDDQVTVAGTVDPQITFNVGSQASATACDGTFAGNGGALPLGSLTPAAVASSDVSSVPHICTRVTTNAPSGAIVTVVSANASLRSVSTPADAIPSSTATLTAGTTGYGLCAGSGGTDSGRDTTTPAGAVPTSTAPFNGSCSTSSHAVGGLTTSPQTVWSLSTPSQNAFFRLFVKAAISPSVPAHTDYADTLTFIATGTY
jgi:Big-like domain-containing protein